MNDSLRIRLGAVPLALFTLPAVIFGLLNWQQRSRFDSPDDGVSWLDIPEGVEAWHISSNSPAAKAGIKPGDILTGVNRTEIRRAVQVTQKLWKAGLWSQVRYRMVRAGREFEAPLITVPAQKPFSIENYLRVVGLLYRSEEHTSDSSHGYISYAVFCLKKKKTEKKNDSDRD